MGFRGVVQEIMKRRVAPGYTVFVGQALEPLQVFFGDPLAGFLISGVTKINSAAQGPRLTGGAELLLLERAEVGRHGLLVWRGAREQDFRLQIAQEQYVAILLE